MSIKKASQFIQPLLKDLLQDISRCQICVPHLPLGPRPVVKAHKKSRILIIGQAPGTAVHKSGVPWDDPSGDQLRRWMGLDKNIFYDVEKIALVPMGFCYPGKGKSGDLPPRKECASFWHQQLVEQLQEIQLILLIGKYAQDYYLGQNSLKTLTDNVRRFDLFLPEYFVLPHPSPRNNIWQAKNQWFRSLVVPELKRYIQNILNDD